mmetsp:Transcript_30718/g.57398  ORF Transcript_30718/g.57398 Transcript_30718/m.57398 type:complete len:331 (-) Transcript_30718:271-1263(-)
MELEKETRVQDLKLTAAAAPSTSAKLEADMLTCSLCLNLVCEPITVPCGHTFCRVCLYMAMQRSKKKCPNCRALCHVEPSSHAVNVMIAKIAQKCFPREYEQRLLESKKDQEKFESTLPIFFYNNCLFPGCLLHLHLFEQRYRHMINRCVSSNRKFIYLPNFTDYKAKTGDVGLLAYIDECEFLPDGRALLKATIQHRVKVTNTWVEEGTQGLHYCQFHPYQEEDKTVDEGELNAVHKEVNMFFDRIPGLKDQIVHHIGKQPPLTNTVPWSFWLASFVTMVSRSGVKAMSLLQSTKTSERLKQSKSLLSQVSLPGGNNRSNKQTAQPMDD